MRKQLKKIMAMLLAAGLMASLAACGGGDAGGSGDTGAAPADNGGQSQAEGGGETTLHWAIWDQSLTTYYQPLIDAYTANHPDVKIEMMDLGSSDYQNALVTQLTGGADLDVV